MFYAVPFLCRLCIVETVKRSHGSKVASYAADTFKMDILADHYIAVMLTYHWHHLLSSVTGCR